MNIAVNTRFLLKNKLEGIGWFTYETMLRITRNHPEHRFFFFFDRKFEEEFVFSKNVTPLILHPQSRHPVLWYWWFEQAVPAALKKVNADLFISTDGFLSLKTDVKTLLVIHDIAFEHFPQHVGMLTRKYLQHYSPLFAKRAQRIATVSEFSKQDIIRTYGIEQSKIDVVGNGAREIYRPKSELEIAAARNKFGISGAYFMYAGAIQPRKNLANIFHAFDAFKEKNPGNVQLVIAGRKAWKFKEALDVYESMTNKADVLFTGHLSSEDLASLMAGAIALLYVSLFEGFGIPIIEAMNCGTPVITSNVSSMPEVAGDAALLVQPESVSEIAEAMEKILKDTMLRKDLIEKGFVQKEKFSWDKTADALWISAEKILYQ
ncbi:MAG: glycosyltransferase family 1 protein [Chitinophagales bacterium]|nr:glycosyltransferase family 1 protein [Chitinophagales bacterium]